MFISPIIIGEWFDWLGLQLLQSCTSAAENYFRDLLNEKNKLQARA